MFFYFADAKFAACSFPSLLISRTTSERTAAKSHTFARFVTKDLPVTQRCGTIDGYTLAKNHTNAIRVSRHSARLHISKTMRKYIRARNHSSATSVRRRLLIGLPSSVTDRSMRSMVSARTVLRGLMGGTAEVWFDRLCLICIVFVVAGQTAPRSGMSNEMIIHKQEKEDSMDQDDIIHTEVVISGI